MKKVERLIELIEQIHEAYYEIDEVLEELSRDNELDDDDKERFEHYYRIFDPVMIDDIWEVANVILLPKMKTVKKTIDRTYIIQEMDKLDEAIKTKQNFLKWAKEDEVRRSLYTDIYELSLRRDIYYNLLKG